jgi:histidine kinase
MKLAWKFLFSHIFVVLIGVLVLAETTSYMAPLTFERHVENMHNLTNHHTEMSAQLLADELNQNFRDALNGALILAFIVSIGAAGLVSLYISRRITKPIQQLVVACQRIANGHYDEQIPLRRNDELGDLIASFSQMANALAQTEHIRQQLIADVSHELKTPLASIKGYMEGLQDGIIPTTPTTFQQISREADRLERLVHDLQELSRAEAGQIPLEFHPVDLRALTWATSEWLQPQFNSKGVLLECQLPAEAVMIRGDYDRLRQVIINILGNALQYTPVDGRVCIQLQSLENHARIQITDTGAGLHPDDLERIFQRFYRVDKSRARASGGSGIGLTIARHIVWLHHGEIWAESPGLGKGSIFHIQLPLLQTA